MIDLWLENLSLTEAEYQHYWRLLDTHEQAKALRFFQENHRRQYVCCHGKLRTILASYTNSPPEQLCFATEEFGKPYLAMNDKLPSVMFNLSHSGNKMLLAVSYQYDIGVDIEAWNNKIDCALIANHCFADSERVFWENLPDNEKDAAFYQFWTRKESFIKAVGAGLSLNVAEVITNTTGFLAIPAVYGTANEWRVLDLDLSHGISAALTVKNIDFEWQWQIKKL